MYDKSIFTIEILEELLEDNDPLNYIKAGAYVDIYDPAAEIIYKKLSKDLSIAQIQKIIWNSIYKEFCIGTVPGTGEKFTLDKKQAVIIIGSPERFKSLAHDIRDKVLGL
jgi:hypothetical protein